MFYCICSTIYGGDYVNILFIFNAFYSGCSKVAVVNIGVGQIMLPEANQPGY